MNEAADFILPADRKSKWLLGLLAATVLLPAAVTAQLHFGIGITFSIISAGLLAWYAMDVRNTIPVKVLALTVSIVALALVERQWFHFVDWAFPLKYDSILFEIDRRFLFDGTICQRLSGTAATDIYEGLGLALIFWFGWLLVTNCPTDKFWKCLVLEYVVGPLFYLLVPACGPIYAGQDAGIKLVLVHGYPNCFPSLHVATALLFIAFRPKGSLFIAVLFALATALTTLVTGQHYVTDIVFALPFAGFAWAAIEGRRVLSITLLAIVLCGAIAIHLL
jgi:hypothetical protein